MGGRSADNSGGIEGRIIHPWKHLSKGLMARNLLIAHPHDVLLRWIEAHLSPRHRYVVEALCCLLLARMAWSVVSHLLNDHPPDA